MAVQLEDHLLSSHALVKALKSQLDTETKLLLARKALADSSLYLPHRYQILQDWIQDAWLRQPAAACDSHLHEIFLSLPILAPTDPTPFINAMLKTLSDHTPPQIVASLRRLHSSNPQPVRPETWVDTVQKFLDRLKGRPHASGWADIWSFLLHEWQADSSDVKKLGITVRRLLPSYLEARSTHTGIENDDDHICHLLLPWTNLESSYTALISASAIEPLMPALFARLVSIASQERYRLFSQPSSRPEALEVYLAARVRSTVQDALIQALERVVTMQVRLQLWRTISQWGGYLESEQTWCQMAQESASIARAALPSRERASALELLGVLGSVDFTAADIDLTTLQWCLAAPNDIRQQAENVLVVALEFHLLTRSLQPFLRLVDEAVGRLIEACDTRSLPSTYDLIVNGPLFQSSVRHAIAHHRPSPKEIGVAVYMLLQPPPLGQDSSAARMGIRTRIIKLLQPSRVDGPVSHPNGMYDGWAAQVHSASRLRLDNILQSRNPEESIVFEATMLPELKAEKIIYGSRILRRHPARQNFLSQLIEYMRTKRSELTKLMDDHGLWGTISQHLDNDQWHLLLPLLDGDSLPAELAECPHFTTAVDRLAITGKCPQSLLPFSSPATQVRALELLVKREAVLSDSTVSWAHRALRTGRVHASALQDLPSVSRSLLRHGDLGLALLLEILENGCLHALDSTLEAVIKSEGLPWKLVGDLPEDRTKLLPALSSLLKFVRHGRQAESLSEQTRGTLVELVSFMRNALRPHLDPFSQDNLSLWLETARIVSWLGLRDCEQSGLAVTGDFADIDTRTLVLLLNILRIEGSSTAPSFALQVMARCVTNHEADLVHEVFRSAGQEELSAAFRSACHGGRPSVLLSALLGLDSKVALDMVREEAIWLLQRLAVDAQAGDISTMVALRRFVERHPYTLGSRDTVNLLTIFLRLLAGPHASAFFPEVVATMTALLRHRRETVIQQPAMLVDICAACFPLFARRSPPDGALSVKDAASLARLLAMLGDGRSRDTPKALQQVLVKHLPAILLAYVRAVADPRSKVAGDIRREMRPGLFVICATVTARGRVNSRGREGEALGDAFGLGEGPGGDVERDAWAELWQTWGKNRYTGQG